MYLNTHNTQEATSRIVRQVYIQYRIRHPRMVIGKFMRQFNKQGRDMAHFHIIHKRFQIIQGKLSENSKALIDKVISNVSIYRQRRFFQIILKKQKKPLLKI